LIEFGASGLAWVRIVEGIIVEELWKHLVNAVLEVVGGFSHTHLRAMPLAGEELGERERERKREREREKERERGTRKK
jgi:hypothetical protein